MGGVAFSSFLAFQGHLFCLNKFTHSYLLVVNDYVSRLLEGRLKRGGRILLYGRRKTGKTTLARKTLNNWNYFYVNRDGSFYDTENDTSFSWIQFKRILEREENIIIDEFHRAPGNFFAFLHAGGGPKNLVLITSTLHYFRKFVEGGEAPLLGLFLPIMVPLLRPIELLAHFEPRTKEGFEKLIFYQEPWTIGKDVGDILLSALDFSVSLLHGAFVEEGITIGERYFHVLQAVAIGKQRPSEISSYLFSHNLLPKDNPALIMKYLDNLVKTGFLEKLEIFGTKKHIYRHVSPVTELAFYLNGKYAFYETGKPIDFGLKVLRAKLPFLMERFMERFLIDVIGGRPVKVFEPEVDILLLEFKKPKVVAEVKWRDEISRKEVERIERKLAAFDVRERILIVPHAENIPETNLEVWDIKDMVKRARTVISQDLKI